MIASVAGRLLRALVVCEEDANLFGDIYHFSLWAVVKVEKEQCKLEKENICLHGTSCALLEQTHFKRVTFHFEAECSPSPVSVTPLQFCCCWRVVCDCFHSSLLSTKVISQSFDCPSYLSEEGFSSQYQSVCQHLLTNWLAHARQIVCSHKIILSKYYPGNPGLENSLWLDLFFQLIFLPEEADAEKHKKTENAKQSLTQCGFVEGRVWAVFKVEQTSSLL